eukprot:m.17026 g.17026  ORF g.17026 m.17026 type:complete len:450 (+) comp3449_c0_seq1:2-1351(+)
MQRRAMRAHFTGQMFPVLVVGVSMVHAFPAPSTQTVGKDLAPLPSLREQAAIRQEWIDYRTEHQLPALMKEYGVTHWVLSQREYHEDVVWRSVASPLSINARRRTVMVYTLTGESVVLSSFVSYEASIWDDLYRVLDAAPGAIALNVDTEFAFSDGLAAGERDAMLQRMPADVSNRIVHVPLLALDFIALRAPTMLVYYQAMMATVHTILAEAFSTRVIQAGVTTCDDVRWWLRDETIRRGFQPGFHPSFSLQRRGEVDKTLSGDTVIQGGDVLWADFGVIGMGLWTDTQHMGYVLREGETAVPAGLAAGFQQANRAQDAVLRHLKPGQTGNEVLQDVVEDTSRQGVDALIYCHPIGDHMHGAGATIGLSDYDNRPIPVKGEVKVRAETWYSVELAAFASVPEWDGQKVRFNQEEDAVVHASSTDWILTRQSALYVIDPWKGGLNEGVE